MRQAGLAQKRGIATQALLNQDLRGGFSVMRGPVPRQRRAQKNQNPQSQRVGGNWGLCAFSTAEGQTSGASH